MFSVPANHRFAKFISGDGRLIRVLGGRPHQQPDFHGSVVYAAAVMFLAFAVTLFPELNGPGFIGHGPRVKSLRVFQQHGANEGAESAAHERARFGFDSGERRGSDTAVRRTKAHFGREVPIAWFGPVVRMILREGRRCDGRFTGNAQEGNGTRDRLVEDDSLRRLGDRVQRGAARAILAAMPRGVLGIAFRPGRMMGSCAFRVVGLGVVGMLAVMVRGCGVAVRVTPDQRFEVAGGNARQPKHHTPRRNDASGERKLCLAARHLVNPLKAPS